MQADEILVKEFTKEIFSNKQSSCGVCIYNKFGGLTERGGEA